MMNQSLEDVESVSSEEEDAGGVEWDLKHDKLELNRYVAAVSQVPKRQMFVCRVALPRPTQLILFSLLHSRKTRSSRERPCFNRST